MPATDSSSSTSATLLDRVRQFDPAAWERLTRLYGPVVYRWSRRAGLQENDVADVAQEVFRSVAANIARFRCERPADSFRGWLWTITRNKIRDHFRGMASRPAAAGGSAQQHRIQSIPETPPDESSDDGRNEQVRLQRRALAMIEAEFPAHQWQAFLRVAVDGHSPADVAEDLGISIWSVYQAKSRVLRRLRQELSDLTEL